LFGAAITNYFYIAKTQADAWFEPVLRLVRSKKAMNLISAERHPRNHSWPPLGRQPTLYMGTAKFEAGFLSRKIFIRSSAKLFFIARTQHCYWLWGGFQICRAAILKNNS
jgi:hypothetical protein